jgi:hypothetical protein
VAGLINEQDDLRTGSRQERPMVSCIAARGSRMIKVPPPEIILVTGSRNSELLHQK